MRRRQSHDDDYFVCPHCGADVLEHATFCRECGASDESGWGEEDYAPDVDGSIGYDDDFDYDEFVAREFPSSGDAKNRDQAKQWLVGLVVAALCVSLVLYMLI